MIAIEDIRARAKELLESGKVRAVLGFRRGTASVLAEPTFVTAPEDTEALVFDATCVENLALYLVNEQKRMKAKRGEKDTRPLAIVAKGCDARAINVLLQENHIKRDEVVILGPSCEKGGMIDPIKLSSALRGKAAIGAVFTDDGNVNVTLMASETTVPAADVLADRCLECSQAYTTNADFAFGEKVDQRDYNTRFTALNTIAEQSMEERSGFWAHHFERCIRCYACRSVCPMCYCDECVVDSINFVVTPSTSADEKANRVRWIQRSTTPSENAMYHLVRAMHLAGRCIDCGECERVCPVNIPIRLLNNVLEREALEMFEYVPGTDPELPSLISSFRDGDPNDFIR